MNKVVRTPKPADAPDYKDRPNISGSKALFDVAEEAGAKEGLRFLSDVIDVALREYLQKRGVTPPPKLIARGGK